VLDPEDADTTFVCKISKYLSVNNPKDLNISITTVRTQNLRNNTLTHYNYSTYYNSVAAHIIMVISNYSQILVYNQWSSVKLQLDTIT